VDALTSLFSLKVSAFGKPRLKRREAGAREGGFTLIEIVVTLMIVGITLAMISVNLRPNDTQTLLDEANRMALMLEMTQEEAMTTGEPMGWTFTDREYLFWRFNEKGEWVRAKDDGFFHSGAFNKAIHMSRFDIGGVRAKQDQRLVFPPTGNVTPYSVTLELNSSRVLLSANALGRVNVAEGKEQPQ